jgi:NADH-quinone oxidoreductase subunit C
MDPTRLLEILRARLPAVVFEPAPSVDYQTLFVPREHIVDALRVLRDDPELSFSTLAEITAADYLPRDPRFEVVYHLVTLGVADFPRPGPAAPPARIRLKVRVPAADPVVPTAVGLFPAANWLEREVWDLFGIRFEGHPDLRRLLMMDDWEGHPLRKDYPVQVRVPYRSSQPVQLTEEEFVANIERQRAASARPQGS